MVKNVQNDFIANVEVEINVPVEKVWSALTDSRYIAEYMLGAEAISKWKKGSEIIWKGSFKGKKYEDKGIILEILPNHILSYTHFSPLSGKPDKPENYHVVSIKLFAKNSHTLLSLSQTNNSTKEESERNGEEWRMKLSTLKKLLENK